MTNNFKIIFLILTLSSCKTETGKSVEIKSEHKIEVEQKQKAKLTNFTIIEIDSLLDNGILTKKIYPNMSYCGGALSGYYYKGELKIIDSKFGAELVFTSKKIYLNGDKILKVNYREYSPEDGKYLKKYPLEKYEYDPSKMTYSDTIYECTFINKYEFQKMAGNKVVSTIIDSTLMKRLTDCGKRMKTELESINEQKPAGNRVDAPPLN